MKSESKIIPFVILILFLGMFASSFRTPKPTSLIDVNRFGQLPVLNGGRIKPLDSVARSSLLLLHGKQTLRTNGKKINADEWLMDVLFNQEKANTYEVFQIDNPDILGILGIQQTAKRNFSFVTLHSSLEEIEKQATRASQLKSDQQSPFQRSIIGLATQINLYQRLQNTVQGAGQTDAEAWVMHAHHVLGEAIAMHTSNPKKSPDQLKEANEVFQAAGSLAQTAEFLPAVDLQKPEDSNRWESFGAAILSSGNQPQLHPTVLAFAQMGDAYRANDAIRFNQVLIDYSNWLDTVIAKINRRSGTEQLFNHVEPFYQSMMMYVAVFLLAAFSWLLWPNTFRTSASWLLILAFAVHTGGLFARMILQGRPPVTNLYSSAIFVGWAAVLLGVVLERLFKNGIGSAVSGAIGFMTLIIAHHLATQGDTMEMMRAVLDSNFWLATHVVCITIGYSSTFLSGFLAAIYVLRRRFDRTWDKKTADSLAKMVYGIVCFSMFFSFLGTILGGIWADQSWGRFWGWDPKENGALMIVLWNAFILHAWGGKMASQRTLMIMAIFGNIVTALSWFGVNMLGIGLHSYGFMDKAFTWLMVFVASQLVLMALGYLNKSSSREK